MKVIFLYQRRRSLNVKSCYFYIVFILLSPSRLFSLLIIQPWRIARSEVSVYRANYLPFHCAASHFNHMPF